MTHFVEITRPNTFGQRAPKTETRTHKGGFVRDNLSPDLLALWQVEGCLSAKEAVATVAGFAGTASVPKGIRINRII